MSRSEESKARAERDVFARFMHAISADWKFESARPPEPDIIAEDRCGGRLGFELIEMMDQDLAHSVGGNIGCNDAKNRILDEDEALRQALRSRFESHHVSIRLISIPKKARLHEVIERVLKTLATLDPGSILLGSNDIPPTLDDCVNRICLDLLPGATNPIFYFHDGAMNTDVSIYPFIEKKLKKVYRVEYPIELLLYTGVRSSFPYEATINALETELAGDARIVSSPFRRIWIFDQSEHRIPFVYAVKVMPPP